MFELVIGGAGSGKSEYAEKLAESLAKQTGEEPLPLIYLATMQVWDEESRSRVAVHRNRREGKGYRTIECPSGIARLSVPEGAVVLLEDLSNLAANELFRESLREDDFSREAASDFLGEDDFSREAASEALPRIVGGLARLLQKCSHLVVVTNDIFEDGGRYDETMRDYLWLLGTLNAKFAKKADAVTEVVCGTPVKSSSFDQMEKIYLGDKAKRILVVGGSCQGKTAFARSLSVHVVDDAQEIIREAMRQGRSPQTAVDEAIQREIAKQTTCVMTVTPATAPPCVVVVMTQIGAGPVPVDPFERRWRDEVGRIGQRLAREADAVYRVFCGIPQRIR